MFSTIARIAASGLLLKPRGNLMGNVTFATFNRQRQPKKRDPTDYRSERKYEDEIQNFVSSNKDLSGVDHLKKRLIETNPMRLNEHSFDAVFMRACVTTRSYDLARMYMDYIETTRKEKPNTATLARFLQLMYFCRNQVTDKGEVERLCETLQSHSEFLDPTSNECLVLALSITSKWETGLELLESNEKAQATQPMNAMIDCLLAHDELDRALGLLEKTLAKKRAVHDFVYEHWIRKCAVDPRAWQLFSTFLSRNEVFLNEPVVLKLKETLARRQIGERYDARRATVDDSGKCRACGQILQAINIAPEDFEVLRTAVMDRVLRGSDVFIGSRPEELTRFQSFVTQTGPYDVVVDGLNVAYLLGKSNAKKNASSKRIRQVLAVVKHFSNLQKSQKVLVLGREHMNYWDPRLMAELKRRAFFFATENTSRDDPFLLYAALQSPATKFISDDLFRDHLFRLADPRLEMLFKQWQRSAQLQIVSIGEYNEKVILQQPLRHRTIAQFADGRWHLPYDDGGLRYNYQPPTTWLCLRPIPQSVTEK